MGTGDLVGLTLALAVVVGLAFLAASPRVHAFEERLGLSVLAWSGLPFLALGALLGARGIGLMDEGVISDLGPAFEFGLGWIGFVIGMRLDIRRLDRMPESFASLVATTSVVPMALTAMASLPILLLIGATPSSGLIRNVAVLSACAAASAPVLRRLDGEGRHTIAQVTGLGEVLALAVLGVVTIVYRPDQAVTLWMLPPSAWLLLLLGLGSLLGFVGYALIRGARSATEELALVIGLVALAAGVTGYVALSIPVVCALAGGLLINLPLADRDGLVRTLESVTRPLYLVFLMVVGASWDFLAWQGWVLALVFAASRLAGTLVATVWAVRLEPKLLPDARVLVSALAPQSPVAVVVIVAASMAWVGQRPISTGWTISAVLIGAILVELLARPLRTRS